MGSSSSHLEQTAPPVRRQYNTSPTASPAYTTPPTCATTSPTYTTTPPTYTTTPPIYTTIPPIYTATPPTYTTTPPTYTTTPPTYTRTPPTYTRTAPTYTTTLPIYTATPPTYTTTPPTYTTIPPTYTTTPPTYTTTPPAYATTPPAYATTPPPPTEPSQIIDPPKKINNIEEFPNVWFKWKDLFHQYVNQLNIPNDKRGMLMLNLMGPVGQQIYRTLISEDSLNQTYEISMLTMKFDMYVLFGKRRKQSDETVVEYVEELRKMVIAKDIFANSEAWIVKKILQEVDVGRFTNLAYDMMPFLTEDISTLELKKIVSIWKVYDSQKPEQNITFCDKCGLMHDKDNCTARGKQCFKCNQWNHLASTCKVSFINDCRFCGMSHLPKRCPAWGKTCELCNKENHFSKQCKIINTLICRFCNCRHVPNRSVCPAKNNICNKCRQMGHYEALCANQDIRGTR